MDTDDQGNRTVVQCYRGSVHLRGLRQVREPRIIRHTIYDTTDMSAMGYIDGPETWSSYEAFCAWQDSTSDEPMVDAEGWEWGA